MKDNPSAVSLRYYGISPWEIEVLRGLFNNKFEIIQEETTQIDTNFVSGLIIIIPVQFSEEFFKWFEFRAWEKVQSILKEMKRRRGKGNAIKIEIVFTGNPNVRLITDLNESHLFNSSIEKIDFVVELLPYHLNEANIPKNPSEVIYKFDTETSKWRLNTAVYEHKKFIFTKNGWQIIT